MSTPTEFSRKLGRTVDAVRHQEHRGIEARALVTKQHILTAAETRTRKVRPSWVRYRIVHDIAEIRLRGGFAHLFQLGSYKHPEGWTETPKGTTVGRRRAAAKKGITLAEHKALHTPYGPRASVHHPSVKAKPFWREGLERSRIPARRAYERSVRNAISTAMR